MGPPQRLLDALHAPSPSAALRDLDHGGELTALLPELEAGRGFLQPELHFYDVLDHNLATVAAIEAALGAGADGAELRASLAAIDVDGSLAGEVGGIEKRTLLRLACLLHDVGKPASAHHDGERLRFPRHGPRGSEMLAARLPALGFAPEATRMVANLVRYHLRPGELVRAWPPSHRAVRKFVTDLDGHVFPLMLVNLADGMATRGPRYTREHYRRHLGFVNYVVARSWEVSEGEEPPLMTGEEVMTELALGSGRLLGAVLTSVRRAQLAGTVSTREQALVLAREVLAGLEAEAS